MVLALVVEVRACRGAEGCASCPGVLNRGRGTSYIGSWSFSKHGHHKGTLCPATCSSLIEAIHCEQGGSRLMRSLYVNKLHGVTPIAGWATEKGSQSTRARIRMTNRSSIFLSYRQPRVLISCPTCLVHFGSPDSGAGTESGQRCRCQMRCLRKHCPFHRAAVWKACR